MKNRWICPRQMEIFSRIKIVFARAWPSLTTTISPLMGKFAAESLLRRPGDIENDECEFLMVVHEESIQRYVIGLPFYREFRSMWAHSSLTCEWYVESNIRINENSMHPIYVDLDIILFDSASDMLHFCAVFFCCAMMSKNAKSFCWNCMWKIDAQSVKYEHVHCEAFMMRCDDRLWT